MCFVFCRFMHEDVNIPPKRQRTQETRYAPDGDDDRMEQCPAPPQQSLFGINMQELDAIIGGRAEEEFPIASEDEDDGAAWAPAAEAAPSEHWAWASTGVRASNTSTARERKALDHRAGVVARRGASPADSIFALPCEI